MKKRCISCLHNSKRRFSCCTLLTGWSAGLKIGMPYARKAVLKGGEAFIGRLASCVSYTLIIST